MWSGLVLRVTVVEWMEERESAVEVLWLEWEGSEAMMVKQKMKARKRSNKKSWIHIRRPGILKASKENSSTKSNICQLKGKIEKWGERGEECVELEETNTNCYCGLDLQFKGKSIIVEATL